MSAMREVQAGVAAAAKSDFRASRPMYAATAVPGVTAKSGITAAGSPAERRPKPPSTQNALRRASRSDKMANGICSRLVTRAGTAFTRPIWALLAPKERAYKETYGPAKLSLAEARTPSTLATRLARRVFGPGPSRRSSLSWTGRTCRRLLFSRSQGHDSSGAAQAPSGRARLAGSASVPWRRRTGFEMRYTGMEPPRSASFYLGLPGFAWFYLVSQGGRLHVIARTYALFPSHPSFRHVAQPHRHVAHVPVLQRGRFRRRLASGPSGKPGRGRSWPSHRGGEGRGAAGQNQPRRPRPVG